MSHGLPFDLDGMEALSKTRREYLSFNDLDTLLDAIPLLCARVRKLSRTPEETP